MRDFASAHAAVPRRSRALVASSALSAAPVAPTRGAPFSAGSRRSINSSTKTRTRRSGRLAQLDPGFVDGVLGRGDDLPPDAVAQRERRRRAADAGAARRRRRPRAAQKRATRRSRRGSARSSASSPTATPTTRRRSVRGRDGRSCYAQEPDDPDVASLYALALLGTMSRSLIGYADAHEGHSQALAGSEIQAQVAEILEGVLRSHPEHPGALHYLLHNHDDPAHAQRALAAARTLARLAPESSHTRHMPAHIFLQLGPVAGRGRARIARRSRRRTPGSRANTSTPAMRNYHALSWLQYELLQLGTLSRGVGHHRRARAGRQSQRPAAAPERSVVDARALRDRDLELAADGRREQLRQRQRAVRDRDERRARRRRHRAERARGGLAERAQDPREGDLRPAIAHDGARGRGGHRARRRPRRRGRRRFCRRPREREAQLPPPLGSAGADQAGAGAARRSAGRSSAARARRFRFSNRRCAAIPIDRCRSSDSPAPPPRRETARTRARALPRAARRTSIRRTPICRCCEKHAPRSRTRSRRRPLAPFRPWIIAALAVIALRRRNAAVVSAKKRARCPGPVRERAAKRRQSQSSRGRSPRPSPVPRLVLPLRLVRRPRLRGRQAERDVLARVIAAADRDDDVLLAVGA